MTADPQESALRIPRDSRTWDRRRWDSQGTNRPGLVGMAGVGAIMAAAAATALLGGSPLLVVLVVVGTGIPLIIWLSRSAEAHRRLMESLHRETRSELDDLQRRWQHLQQEAEQTTSALSRMRDGVILLSRHEEILLINPAARRLLSVSSEQDLVGRHFQELVRYPDLTRAVAAARAGDGTQKRIIEITDGEVMRPITVRVDRFTTGGESNLLMTVRDETESYRVDAMRREFIANISHELKTPLAAIKGYAETVELAIKDDPDAAVHFMSQINSQCLRLERLIADMMLLARAQSGRGQLNLTSVSLSDVINESLKSYRPVAEAKHIALSVDDPPGTALVHADADAALTIANNLIGNAIHYTPDGGQVRVFFREAGKFWALVVEDTGVGIAASEQKRIFERFYRVDKSRRGDDGGTGLGLSIVKNLTQTLGGEVRLRSRPGEGSKFEVLLPRENTEL